MPLFWELLIINKILGPTVSITSLRNLVEIKPRLQLAGFICNMSFVKNGSEWMTLLVCRISLAGDVLPDIIDTISKIV